jgi:hypothetical protein
MNRRNAIALAALALVALPLVGNLQADPPGWKAGVAKANITPEKPLWLAGYSSRTRAAEGTVHALWIKVLALEAPNRQRAVIVTSDLLGFPKATADKICEGLHRQCGLERAEIMLTCSHTHSGPVLANALFDCYPLDDTQRELIAEYSSALEKKVVATVAQALAAMTPATLSSGTGEAAFAVNRRNNREPDVLKLRKSGAPVKGPVDHSVPVLAVKDLGGKLRAVVFGYACHNTTLCDYQWCGDYAGFAQVNVEQKHPEALAMFYIGCGADQNPIPRRSLELAQNYGTILSAAVEEVLGKSMQPVEPELKTAFATVDLTVQPLPAESELRAMTKANNYRARWATRMLGLLAQKQPLPTSYPYPIQAWKLGKDQRWIALGGEVVVDYAIKLKAQYGKQTWVAGYANDVMSYIPSRRVWDEGGYEQGAFEVYGMPAKGWTADVEEKVLHGVEQVLGQLDR